MDLVARGPSALSPFRVRRPLQNLSGRITAGIASPDGRYRLIVFGAAPFPIGKYISYYVPIVAGVAFLCWALAVRIASPLRELASVVDRFGRGDLTARAMSRRRDEIGDLALRSTEWRSVSRLTHIRARCCRIFRTSCARRGSMKFAAGWCASRRIVNRRVELNHEIDGGRTWRLLSLKRLDTRWGVSLALEPFAGGS